jgi:hypothetical protein
MVAGYFVGRLMGEFVLPTSVAEEPARIFSPDLQQYLAFPCPLLGPPLASEADLLPALLESLPLALLAANREGDLRALMPYQRLRWLGEPLNASNVLRTWLSDGSTPAATVPIDRAWKVSGSQLARSADASEDDRKKAVLDYLESRRVRYVDKLEEIKITYANFFQTPRTWELRSEYDSALADLIAMVGGIRPDEGDGD